MCHMPKKNPYKIIKKFKWMDIDLKLNRTESRSGLAAALVFIQWETFFQFLLLLQTPLLPSSSFCTSLAYYEVLIWGTYETSTLDSPIRMLHCWTNTYLWVFTFTLVLNLDVISVVKITSSWSNLLNVLALQVVWVSIYLWYNYKHK